MNSDTGELAKLPRGQLVHACARGQHQVHDLLVSVIKNYGRTQKELAIVTGIDEATISRLLRRPNNVEVNTISKLLYGTCGAFLAVSMVYPQNTEYPIFSASKVGSVHNTKNHTFFCYDEETTTMPSMNRPISTAFGAESAQIEMTTNRARIAERRHA